MKTLPINLCTPINRPKNHSNNISFREKWYKDEYPTDFYGSGSNGNATVYTCKKLYPDGKIKEELEYYVGSNQHLRKWKEYGYHPNGKLKFVYDHIGYCYTHTYLNDLDLPGHSSYRYNQDSNILDKFAENMRFVPHKYIYTEYDDLGNIIKERNTESNGLFIEHIYNEKQYPFKEILNNVFINDEYFDTVELLYRNSNDDEIPDAYINMLGKNSQHFTLVKLLGKSYMNCKDFTTELISKKLVRGSNNKFRLISRANIPLKWG